MLNEVDRRIELVNQALDSAQNVFGPVSAEVGLYLMDLADLLEESGRLEESRLMARRYHSILLKLAVRSGILGTNPYN